MPRFQRLRMSGRREQQVSTSLGRRRVSLPRARSVDFGAVSAPVSESTTHYSGLEEERSFYPREVSGTKSLQRQSSMDSETASASQRSTCSPSSLYSLTSPCLDLQPRPSRQTSVGALTRTASRQSTEGITGRQLRDVERSEDGEPYYLNGAERFFTRPPTRRSSSVYSTESEPVPIPASSHHHTDRDRAYYDEEAWASLWDTYRRLFPGSLEGCSPPPEEYFLHSRGSNRGRRSSPLAPRSGIDVEISPAWAGVSSEGALVGAGARERIYRAGLHGEAVAPGGKGVGVPPVPGRTRGLKQPVSQLSEVDAGSLLAETVLPDPVRYEDSAADDLVDEGGRGGAAVGDGEGADAPDGDNGPGGWLQFDMEM